MRRKFDKPATGDRKKYPRPDSDSAYVGSLKYIFFYSDPTSNGGVGLEAVVLGGDDLREHNR